MGSSVPMPVSKTLWAISAGRCYLCHVLTYYENSIGHAKVKGEQAHIYGEKPDAARYDPKQPKEFVNSHKNLIIACGTCHKVIDGNEIDYPVEKLFEIKAEHERNIKQLQTRATLVLNHQNFREMEDVLAHFSSKAISKEDEFDPNLTSVPQKAKINNLSEEIQSEIIEGLSRANDFSDFLNNHPEIGFEKKLKFGFINVYIDLLDDGYRGDSIYYALKEFAVGERRTDKRSALATVVIAYYFEKCDIFEK